jgi:hypothetical protein
MDGLFPRGPDTPSVSNTDYSSDATDVSSFCDQSEDHEDGIGPFRRRAGQEQSDVVQNDLTWVLRQEPPEMIV